MALAASSPAYEGGGDASSAAADDAPSELIAVVRPTAGNDVSGTVVFERVPEGVEVSGEISGLNPGEHGFHVHEYGDLSAPDGTSAGGHFNPTGSLHGGPEDERRHVGDLGNITADDRGGARFSFVDDRLAMEGEKSIVGRGLIVHEGRDDLVSQPTGAAGARVGMAVIGISNQEEE